MLFSIDEAITIVHGCWNKTILIDQACSLSHVIIVAQPCYQVVTVLMVEQRCNNIVIMAGQPC